MNTLNQLKLKEIVESVKEEYLLNSLEETTSEIETLRTKKFLNETAATIEHMLLNEGAGEWIKNKASGAYNAVKAAPGQMYGAMKAHPYAAAAGVGAAGATGAGLTYQNELGDLYNQYFDPEQAAQVAQVAQGAQGAVDPEQAAQMAEHLSGAMG